MIIPVVVNMLVSVALMGANHDIDMAGKSQAQDHQGGMVLGAFAAAGNVLQAKSSKAGFSNNLPENGNSFNIPQIKEEAKPLSLDAASGAAVDKKTGKILWGKSLDDVRPIASISKLMTALVFLDNNPGWDEIYEIRPGDIKKGGRIYLGVSEKVKVKDLFNLSLVASANTATAALANSTGMSQQEFIKEMNKKARELGLYNTNFSEPSGLSRFNVSTAEDVALLAKASFSNRYVKEAVLRDNYDFKTLNGRRVCADSTDELLNVFPSKGINLLGGKTGYTSYAGACFVALFSQNSEKGDIISVILGGKNIDSRFEQTKKLVEWSYDSYEWQ